jgi:archaellum component FlaG (FlaF/FlaG flagellin family)
MTNVHPATRAAAARKAAAVDALFVTFAGLKDAIADNDNLPASNFRDSVAFKILNDPKKVTTRMVDTFINAVAKDKVWAANRVARVAADAAAKDAALAAGVTAPSGRVAVTGKVVHTKFVPNDFGGAMKMLVALDTGAKVWVSIPDAIGGFDLKNKMVAFTATFTVSDTDPLFAFGKRPSNAVILSDVTDDVAKAAHDTAVMNDARDARMNSDGLPPLAFNLDSVANIKHVGWGF